MLWHQKGGNWPIFKILLLKPLVGFQYNLIEMFLGWPSIKTVQIKLIGWKIWLQGGIRKRAKWQFLAHQNTKCSRYVFMIAFCLSSVVNFCLVNTLLAPFCIQYSGKLIKTFLSIKSRTSLKLGNMRSKSRSLGQIERKCC